MTEAEYKRLIKDVDQAIQFELRGTIPPSIDIGRNIDFKRAAEKAVSLCLKKTNTEVS